MYETGGRTVFVQPLLQIVEPRSAGVTSGLRAPGVRAGSGRPGPRLLPVDIPLGPVDEGAIEAVAEARSPGDVPALAGAAVCCGSVDEGPPETVAVPHAAMPVVTTSMSARSGVRPGRGASTPRG